MSNLVDNMKLTVHQVVRHLGPAVAYGHRDRTTDVALGASGYGCDPTNRPERAIHYFCPAAYGILVVWL